MRRGRGDNNNEGIGRRQRRVAEGRKVRKDRGEVHKGEEEEEDEEKTEKRQKVAERGFLNLWQNLMQIRVTFQLHLGEFIQKVVLRSLLKLLLFFFLGSTLCTCLDEKNKLTA